MPKVFHSIGQTIAKDTVGEQVIISTRSFTPLHQRMELNRSRQVRKKEKAICADTPASMAVEASILYTRKNCNNLSMGHVHPQ